MVELRTRNDVFRHIAAQIEGDAPIMPGLPQVLLRVRDALDDEELGAKDLATVILDDPSLTASVMRLANSAYYRHTRAKVRTVTSAIILLGFETVRNLVLGLSVYNMLSNLPKVRNYRQLWRHSLCCGVCAQNLAQKVGLAIPEEAFVAGLLHDMGKFVMGQFLPEHYARVLTTVQRSGLSFMDAERDILKVDHMEVGEFVARHWSFPDEVIEAIGHHEIDTHDGTLNPDLPSLRKIVIIANKTAHMLYRDEEPGQSIVSTLDLSTLCETGLGLDDEKTSQVVGQLKSDVRRVARMLDIVIDDWRYASGTHPKISEQADNAPNEKNTPATDASARLDLVLWCHEQAHSAEGLIEYLKATSPKLREVLDLAHVFYLGASEDRTHLQGTFGYGRGIDGVRETIHIATDTSDDVAARAFLQRAPVVVSPENMHLFSRLSESNLISMLATSNVAAHPVIAGERCEGVLVITRHKDSPPLTSEEAGILSLYAQDLSALLERIERGSKTFQRRSSTRILKKDNARRRGTTRILKKDKDGDHPA